MILHTIGISGKSAESFFRLLQKNKVTRLIDIRLNNKSQLAGFANATHLPYFLRLHNMEYIYKPEYAPTKQLLVGYKKKNISWPQYMAAYHQLLISRNILKDIEWPIFDNAVLLCSEATAAQCHRRLLAEYLKNNNSAIQIKHL